MNADLTPNPCDCPICVSTRSVEALQGAHEAWLEREAESQMAYAYLLDEVREALKPRNALTMRRRLRQALDAVRGTP